MEYYNFTSGDYENLILKDIQLRERELKIKADFQKWLRHNRLTIPYCFEEDNEDIRFYLASGRDFQQTYEAMIENEKWMLEQQMSIFSRYEEFVGYLDAGVIYGYQRDKGSRPIIVVSIRKLVDTKMDVDTFLDLTEFLCSYTQYHALVPGKVETWILLADFKDVGLAQIPVNQLKQMSVRSRRNFKMRMFNLITVNMSWVVKQASNIIFTFLDARLTNKIKIFTDNGSSYLDQIVEKDHREQKFGGTLPNRTTEFFPPRYNPM